MEIAAPALFLETSRGVSSPTNKLSSSPPPTPNLKHFCLIVNRGLAAITKSLSWVCFEISSGR